jgi:Ti-type conjugative transfer relaxase TraA
MAIYHFSAKVIGRSQGRSAVAAAAYRSASELLDEHLDRTHDYTAKADVVHSEILLPEGAPERWRAGEDASAEEQRIVRERLWNEVEATEKRRDAQLARDIEIALPRELTRAEGIALARDFVREQFVSRGMVADLNVHWGVGADGEVQPHAHVMLTMREIVPGPGRHPEEARFGKKVVAWNDRALLKDWRERWAEMANARLAELGHDVRIDHRSYAEQGIDLEPQHKIGPAGARREERQNPEPQTSQEPPAQNAERRAEHRAIARRNGERIAADPNVALDALTRQHSTFSKQDLARFVDRHTDEAEQFAQVMARVEAAPELVRLGRDGRGRERFSTRGMLEAEQCMEQAGTALAGRGEHGVLRAASLLAVRAAERGGLALGNEQAAALLHVTGGPDLALVVGFAGTGKSAMLGVARQAWEAEGYRVRGATLSGIAAEGLEAGSGIGSRTLASLEFGWKDGRDGLTNRDVLVVDEAGMIGSRQMERVLSAASAAGAKVVLVGDPEQLQAIEAGAAFRALAERHGAVAITAVRRQREAWQRDATRELATGRTAEALERYAGAGMVQAAGTRTAAKAALVAGWDAVRQESPSSSQVILAYTRDDVRDLNELARERMRLAGALRGADQVVQTERGARFFAAGDRVMFGRNERGLGGHHDRAQGVAVKNGSLGTVLAVEAGGERLTVRLDGAGGAAGEPGAGSGAGQEGRKGSDAAPVVTFYVRDYGHLDHGYAATVHKAQGVTVDRAHVLATPHMDRHAAYVGLTRHRDAVALHYAAEDFADPARLARALGRERAKDTTLDYGGEADPVRRYAERRGLDPLRPESEIVVQVPVLQPEATSVPAPRRGRFAGLRLDASRPAELPAPVLTPPPPAPARVPPERERQRAELEGLAADYARAWLDAERMRQAVLPVLPHQEQALATAGRGLDGLGAGASRDMQAALDAGPGLAEGARTPAGMQALLTAMGGLRRDRLALEGRGREAVRAWDGLEQAYEAAGKRYAWDEQREAGTRLEAFAQELKRDPQLDGLLRERGRELGIEAGSRLDRVVQAPEVDGRLLRSVDIEHGPRLRSGPSLSAGM